MKKVATLLFLVVISLALLSACAKPKAKITYLELPRGYKGEIKKIAVLPFESRRLDGRILASEIEAELLQVRVNGRPYFKVVSRADIDKVLSEIKFSSSGLTSEQVELGKLLKAEGLLLGTADVTYSTDMFYRKKKECIETKGSGLIKECVRYEERNVPCQTRFVRLTLVPKLIDVERGEVVYSRRIVKEAKHTYCRGDWREPKSFSELLSEAKTQAIKELIKDIAPYRVTVVAEFIDDDKGVKEKDIFKEAIELAKKGKAREACRLFKGINSRTYAVLYNKGLCMELEGDLRGARDLYFEAKKLKSDVRIENALGRVIERMQKEAQLRELVE